MFIEHFSGSRLLPRHHPVKLPSEVGHGPAERQGRHRPARATCDRRISAPAPRKRAVYGASLAESREARSGARRGVLELSLETSPSFAPRSDGFREGRSWGQGGVPRLRRARRVRALGHPRAHRRREPGITVGKVAHRPGVGAATLHRHAGRRAQPASSITTPSSARRSISRSTASSARSVWVERTIRPRISSSVKTTAFGLGSRLSATTKLRSGPRRR